MGIWLKITATLSAWMCVSISMTIGAYAWTLRHWVQVDLEARATPRTMILVLLPFVVVLCLSSVLSLLGYVLVMGNVFGLEDMRRLLSLTPGRQPTYHRMAESLLRMSYRSRYTPPV